MSLAAFSHTVTQRAMRLIVTQSKSYSHDTHASSSEQNSSAHQKPEGIMSTQTPHSRAEHANQAQKASVRVSVT